jgi:hypothetical protein
MKRKIEPTPDGHYVIIDGRKWRATNPNLPEDVRQNLVNELMSARRAVAAALKAKIKRQKTRRATAFKRRKKDWASAARNGGKTREMRRPKARENSEEIFEQHFRSAVRWRTVCQTANRRIL